MSRHETRLLARLAPRARKNGTVASPYCKVRLLILLGIDPSPHPWIALERLNLVRVREEHCEHGLGDTRLCLLDEPPLQLRFYPIEGESASVM